MHNYYITCHCPALAWIPRCMDLKHNLTPMTMKFDDNRVATHIANEPFFHIKLKYRSGLSSYLWFHGNRDHIIRICPHRRINY